MEVQPCPDRSDIVLDWAVPGDDLCSKSSRLKEKLVFQRLKGNLRSSRKEKTIAANLSYYLTILV